MMLGDRLGQPPSMVVVDLIGKPPGAIRDFGVKESRLPIESGERAGMGSNSSRLPRR